MRQIYEKFYKESDYGTKRVFVIEYEKEKSNYSSLKKYATFEDSDTTLSTFLESIEDNNDFIIRVHFARDSKVSLNAFDASEVYEKSQSGSVSIEDCLEKFRIEELLKDDNKYYCGK